MLNRMLSGIIIMEICMVTLMGCNNMKFNQTTNKSDLLTVKYPVIQIDEIQGAAETGDVTFSDFESHFEVQCMRKTHQGYYVVLLLEDGRNAFAFFNEKNTLTRIMVLERFKSKIEFQNEVVEQISKSEVLNLDSNTIIAPVSALDITAHIVQEGIFVVKYSRFWEGEIIEDPIVTSIQFIDNESLLTNEDVFIRNEIPFVLELDKASE